MARATNDLTVNVHLSVDKDAMAAEVRGAVVHTLRHLAADLFDAANHIALEEVLTEGAES